MVKAEKIECFKNDKRLIMNCLLGSELSEKEFGQLYCTRLYPKSKVGGHYHKVREEWLFIINGKVKLFLEDVRDNSKKEMTIEGDDFLKIKIPPFVAHTVENISEDVAILIEYSTLAFDPDNEDKYPHKQ